MSIFFPLAPLFLKDGRLALRMKNLQLGSGNWEVNEADGNEDFAHVRAGAVL